MRKDVTIDQQDEFGQCYYECFTNILRHIHTKRLQIREKGSIKGSFTLILDELYSSKLILQKSP